MEIHIDLGQIIIASILTSLAVIGYLIKREVGNFAQRLDKHEDIILRLVGDVQRLIGISMVNEGGRNDQRGRVRWREQKDAGED